MDNPPERGFVSWATKHRFKLYLYVSVPLAVTVFLVSLRGGTIGEAVAGALLGFLGGFALTVVILCVCLVLQTFQDLNKNMD